MTREYEWTDPREWMEECEMQHIEERPVALARFGDDGWYLQWLVCSDSKGFPNPFPLYAHHQNITYVIELLREIDDLLPRISDDDPMAPALAAWLRRVRMVRAALVKAKGQL